MSGEGCRRRDMIVGRERVDEERSPFLCKCIATGLSCR